MIKITCIVCGCVCLEFIPDLDIFSGDEFASYCDHCWDIMAKRAKDKKEGR